MPDIKGKFSDDAYNWIEIGGKTGRGNRGFRVTGPGLARGGLELDISPNPHDNPDYNNDGQEDFYAGIAKVFDKGWPSRGKPKYKPIKEPSDLPDTQKKLKAEMLKMKKDKQEKAIENYNEEQEKAAKEQVQTDYEEAVRDHLARKTGSKFTYGGIIYTIG